MQRLFFFFIFSTACSPNWVDIKPTDESNSPPGSIEEIPNMEYDTAGSTDTSSNNGYDEDTSNSNDNDEDSNTPDEPEFRITSGTWNLEEATTVSDPCGWNTYLYSWLSFDVYDFLPSSFTITPEADQFGIKANNFGAQDTISCTLDGDDFSCTLQTVDAQELTPGWPRYWEYQIDFSGSILDASKLVGRASVSFPQVNPGDDFNLQVFGMEHTECGQTYDLTLVATN